MSQQKREKADCMERKRKRCGCKERKQELLFFIEQLRACNPNQWVISASLATNIYLKLFTEGRAVQLESRGQR